MGKGVGARRKLFTLGGPRVVIAVDDAVTSEVRAQILQTLGVSLRRARGAAPEVEIVRAAELADPYTEADFYFGAYTPATPDCDRVVEFIQPVNRISAFEQDRRTGAVYRDGQQVWASAPIATARVGAERSDRLGVFHLQDWALLFADGARMRITTIPDVFREPGVFTTRPPRTDEQVPSDWLARAQAALTSS